MRRRRCAAEHLAECRVERAELRDFGGGGTILPIALETILILRGPMLIRVPDRMRKCNVLREEHEGAKQPKKHSLNAKLDAQHGLMRRLIQSEAGPNISAMMRNCPL